MCRWGILLKWAEEIIHRALYRKQYWGFINMVIKLLIPNVYVFYSKDFRGKNLGSYRVKGGKYHGY